MKEVSKEVFINVKNEASGKKERTKVGTVTVKFAETIHEALEWDGETKLLQKRNSQTLTTAMNDLRESKRTGPSKTKLTNEAYGRITQEEWMQVAGDKEAIQRLLEKKIEEIREEHEIG